MARDNFGPNVAQVAAVALLIDYTVTVAVQTSAGTAALTSAFRALDALHGVDHRRRHPAHAVRQPPRHPRSRLHLRDPDVLLRGVAVVRGDHRAGQGRARRPPRSRAAERSRRSAIRSAARAADGSWGWASSTACSAFANGGFSLTGLEAVSDGISSFRAPEARNGRMALVTMCLILGFLVLGTSMLAHLTHAVPYAGRHPDGRLPGGAVRPRQHVGRHRRSSMSCRRPRS